MSRLFTFNALKRLTLGAAWLFAFASARALLIFTGALLTGAVIFTLLKTTGFNIDHTIFILVPCFIIAHLIGYFTDIYCNIAWLVWSPLINRLRASEE
jgi:hypothetical protein